MKKAVTNTTNNRNGCELCSQVQGVTKFSSSASVNYRYSISRESAKVNIWLEDRSSKKAMGNLNAEESRKNVVDASAQHYVTCLDYPLDNSEDAQRTLIPLHSGQLQLELSFQLRLLRSVCNVKYVFELKHDRVNIRASQLKKNQQEELDKLCGRVDATVSTHSWASSMSAKASTSASLARKPPSAPLRRRI
ncbi:hypothetical protein ON010_g2798 [Phytophthora cinnamomi]|nr:hypothetical protein ON010_g2798 [Phytophthora cinnamomi]